MTLETFLTFSGVAWFSVHVIFYVVLRIRVGRKSPNFDSASALAYVLEYKRVFGPDRLYKINRYGPLLLILLWVSGFVWFEILGK